jgi:type I restriction enzyme S subunit
MTLELPASWETTMLDAVATKFLSGGTPPTKNEEYWKGPVPWITSKWLNAGLYLDSGEKFISEEAVKRSATVVVPLNSLIFATRVGVGKVSINRIDLAINQDLAGILLDTNRYDIRFLAYQLRSDRVQKVVEAYKRGATIQGITRDNLKSLEIYVPPLVEQQKIASILGLAQRAVEEQEALLAAAIELKACLLSRLFTKGLRGEAQKSTDIGQVPESWHLMPLEHVGEVIYGIQAAVAANIEPRGTKILTNKNITLGGTITLENVNYFELKTSRHHATILQKGDLLFNWRSGSKEHLGKTAYFDLDGEFTHSSFILRIRPQDEITGRFLFYYLRYLRESGFFLKGHTFSINAKFNKSAVNKLPVFLPARDERRDITLTLDATERKIAVIQEKRRLFQELFQTLLYRLMSARTRVDELDLQELVPAEDGVSLSNA